MNLYPNLIVEHARLGTVTVLGPEITKPGKWRVAVLAEWQSAPMTFTRTERGNVHVDFPVTVHVVEADTLTRRPSNAGDVEAFMRAHSKPRWKPKPLPKFRPYRRLSDEKLAALMREQGATGSFGE